VEGSARARALSLSLSVGDMPGNQCRHLQRATRIVYINF
jgi:hypothetical protein